MATLKTETVFPFFFPPEVVFVHQGQRTFYIDFSSSIENPQLWWNREQFKEIMLEQPVRLALCKDTQAISVMYGNDILITYRHRA